MARASLKILLAKENILEDIYELPGEIFSVDDHSVKITRGIPPPPHSSCPVRRKAVGNLRCFFCVSGAMLSLTPFDFELFPQYRVQVGYYLDVQNAKELVEASERSSDAAATVVLIDSDLVSYFS